MSDEQKTDAPESEMLQKQKAALGDPKQNRKTYDEKGRAARVIASQGGAPGTVDQLPEKYIKRLAALSDERGVVSKEAPEKFNKIRRELIDEHKATLEGLEAKGKPEQKSPRKKGGK